MDIFRPKSSKRADTRKHTLSRAEAEQFMIAGELRDVQYRSTADRYYDSETIRGPGDSEISVEVHGNARWRIEIDPADPVERKVRQLPWFVTPAATATPTITRCWIAAEISEQDDAPPREDDEPRSIIICNRPPRNCDCQRCRNRAAYELYVRHSKLT
jgi:hypothetical protein